MLLLVLFKNRKVIPPCKFIYYKSPFKLCSNDELEILVDGRQGNETVVLPRPKYDSKDGKYVYSDVSSTDDFILTDYWPVRMKIMKSSGKMSLTLNRVLVEYTYSDYDSLATGVITIESEDITNVITPLN